MEVRVAGVANNAPVEWAWRGSPSHLSLVGEPRWDPALALPGLLDLVLAGLAPPSTGHTWTVVRDDQGRDVGRVELSLMLDGDVVDAQLRRAEANLEVGERIASFEQPPQAVVVPGAVGELVLASACELWSTRGSRYRCASLSILDPGAPSEDWTPPVVREVSFDLRTGVVRVTT